MKRKPDTPEETWAMVRRQLTLVIFAALSMVITHATEKLFASDLEKTVKQAEVENAEVIGWESFNDMMNYYEGRIDDLEERLEKKTEECGR